MSLNNLRTPSIYIRETLFWRRSFILPHFCPREVGNLRFLNWGEEAVATEGVELRSRLSKPLDVQTVEKQASPRGANEQDRMRYQKSRDYMVRIDDMLACRSCRRRFDIPSSQSVVFL